MTKDQDDIVKLHQWYDLLQQTEPGSEVIKKIEARINSVSSNTETAKTLSYFLASEFHRQGKYAEAEQILLGLATKFSNDPTPLISLAEQKLYFEQKPSEAIDLVNRAIERANKSGNFRRQALGVKARIAKDLKRYDIVEDVLRTLMNLRFEPGNIDIGVERDFFDRLPRDVIEQRLAEQYDRFSR